MCVCVSNLHAHSLISVDLLIAQLRSVGNRAINVSWAEMKNKQQVGWGHDFGALPHLALASRSAAAAARRVGTVRA
jgi:hypothetical protein